MTTLKPPFTAKDMKSLYVKVIRGHYPKISSRYSDDLASVISKCLKTSPSKRATAKILMETPELNDHINDVQDGYDTIMLLNSQTNLLNTIKLPKKLLNIAKRLPKANYSTPVVTKTKALEIKIAKGFPKIFEKTVSQQSSTRRKNKHETVERSNATPKVNYSVNYDSASRDLQSRLHKRLLKRVTRQNVAVPMGDYPAKISLPKIQRVNTDHQKYLVNYSSRSLSGIRPIIR
jgi:serine/threonine protein kinase